MKKMKNKKGFTLIEMLATIIVLLLVTEIISLTIQMSSKYYTKSVRDSESQTICETLATAIQEELQYATKIQPNADGSFTYYSRARQHGSSCSLVCKDGKIYVHKGENDYAIVGSKTYTYDLKADMTCTWEDTHFIVDLNVKSGETVLASQNFQVYPLNEGF